MQDIDAQAPSVSPPARFQVHRIDYEPGERLRTHWHPWTSVTLVLAGLIRETTPRGEATATALMVAVKPAGVRHANEIGPTGATTLQIGFGREATEQLGEESGIDRRRWIECGFVVAPFLAVARRLASGGDLVHGLEDDVVEALAAVGAERPGSSGVPGWLARAKEAIDDELESGISLRDLAGHVGAHPVTVSRAFRAHYGRTITEYRRAERVRRAAAFLDRTGTSLSRVAQRAGYADHPHFCREFRKVTGVTPSQFRSLANKG